MEPLVLLSPILLVCNFGELVYHFVDGKIKAEWSATSQQRSSNDHCFHRQEFQHFSPPPGTQGIPTSYSAYYNISVAKAELLNKLKDQPEIAEIGLGEEEVDYELAQKKVKFLVYPRDFWHLA